MPVVNGWARGRGGRDVEQSLSLLQVARHSCQSLSFGVFLLQTAVNVAAVIWTGVVESLQKVH